MRDHAPAPSSQLDHLVVAAATLDDGVAWCEATLGVTPGPGGAHPLMGTHNRLLNVSSPAFANAYLEIIAIDSGAPCARRDGARRWFDLDDAALQAQLATTGPRLIHFVAATAQAASSLQALAQLDIDRGELLQASRMTTSGLLSWQISVRPDGQRLFDGALPTLIEWGKVHPTHHMPASGVRLQSLHIRHPQAQALQAAYRAMGLANVAALPGPPNTTATLQTPLGLVQLQSRGI